MFHTDSKQQEIQDYWNVKPPFRADESHEPGSIGWYAGISEHRYAVVPYMRGFVGFDRFNGAHVLEIGYGAGTDFCEFARNGACMTGVDITEAAVSLTSQRMKVEGLHGTVTRYDGRTLPFPDGAFDMVYSWGVLHHSPHMADLFCEAHRVLKKGGTFMMMLYHRRSAIFFYSILYLRRYIQKIPGSRSQLLARYSEFREHCPHTEALTAEEVREMLWFFDMVKATVDYPVYDGLEQRKLPLEKPLAVEKTGLADLDLFMESLNNALRNGQDMRPFGWHLLVKAVK